MVNENVVELIRRCLALSKSSNEHEAAAAAAKANELLLKYKLSLAEVQGAAAGKEEKVTETIITIQSGDKKWRRHLAGIVARNNFCQILINRGRGVSGGRVWFIGKPTDAQVAIDIYEWLSLQIGRLADEAWRQERQREAFSFSDGNKGPSALRFRVSFAWGACSTISNRFYQERKAQTAGVQGAQVTALVKVEDAAVAQYMGTKFGRLRATPRGRVTIDNGAWSKGAAAAHDISLRRPGALGGGHKALPSG